MSKKPSKVVVKIEKNRLYIAISGRLDKKQLEALYTEIRFCVADLKPGFSVITDLSDCTVAALGGIQTFRKITNYLLTNKVGRVVRVVDKEMLVLRQLLNFTSKITGYKADLFYNLEEAETALMDSERRDDLRFVLHDQNVEFSVNGVNGKGVIDDISTSGCAIKTTDKVPQLQDKLILVTEFTNQENMLNVLKHQSTVVWVEEACFGVRFEDMGNEVKMQLWERLVHESSCDLPQTYQ